METGGAAVSRLRSIWARLDHLERLGISAVAAWLVWIGVAWYVWWWA